MSLTIAGGYKMEKQKLVLIGNGMAGVQCIEKIIKENPGAYQITVFGSEPHPNYSRIMLSSVLQGGTTVEDIVINSYEWYETNNIQLFAGETVTHIDQENKKVISDKLTEVYYDKLILATGSTPFMLPLPGADKEGVISFRTIEDCEKMIETSANYKKAVVIGGGLLGLEAARGLLNLGMNVDVVHLAGYLMERQLDSEASRMLQKELEAQGMNFLLEKASDEIIGNERVEGLRFKDGSEIKADLVVMAVGVRPNVQLAKDSGIETNRGIIVDDFMATGSPDIYAVGECAEHRGMVYGLVKPLYEQGKVLANHLCGKETAGYSGSVLSTQLKISGVEVFSVGQFTPDDTVKSIQYHNQVEAVYKKVFFRGNKAVGAVLYGDAREGPRLLDTIVKQKIVSDMDKPSLLESPDPADSFVASLPQTEHICTCNAVSKGSIIQAVQQKQLTTPEEVKKCTKASSSCGGCKPAVAELLSYIHSDAFNENMEIKQKSLCGCTSLSEDEVVERIQLESLASIQEVFKNLNWKNKNGCSTCLPALEYYLGMIYPEYETESKTVFLNEKMNATLQKDGTYTIIPQTYGGVLNVEQLNKITEVAKKYPLTTIAIASDQRIHLMGVQEKDLSSVWGELNMPLRVSTGNTVETIKTSVGEHICRCDKHPSLQLAELVEKRTEFISTPHRIKIGISSCTHNGAGSTTKDIGAIKMDRGWEIYVGGSSGRNVRPAELFCVVESTKEASEIISSFIQYYRESANYQERSWQWMERIGLVHLREVLFDEVIRQELLEHLDISVGQRKGYAVSR